MRLYKQKTLDFKCLQEVAGSFDPLGILPRPITTRNLSIKSEQHKSEQQLWWFGGLEVQNVFAVEQEGLDLISL